jgi:hypothetical protein
VTARVRQPPTQPFIAIEAYSTLALSAPAAAWLTLPMFRIRFPLRAWLVIIATLLLETIPS